MSGTPPGGMNVKCDNTAKLLVEVLTQHKCSVEAKLESNHLHEYATGTEDGKLNSR